MDIDSIRHYCLSLDHVTEDIQWEDDLLFRIGGKIFAVVNLNPAAATRLSFKCTPEEFAELTENEDIIPAPYVARYHWVALLRVDALRDAEIQRLIRKSYDMVLEKLPARARASLDSYPRKATAAARGRKRR